MTSPAFYRSRNALRLLERAADCTAAPVAVHYMAEEGERVCVSSVGQCAACAYVNAFPEGKAACRASRARAMTLSLRNQKPEPFRCHLGFSCVAAPLSDKGETGFVLVAGPFTPSEAPYERERDVFDGLHALGEDIDDLPFPLDDVALAPAKAVPAMTGWAAEHLRALQDEAQDEAQDEPDQAGPAHSPSRPVRSHHRLPQSGPYQASDVAAALAAGSVTQARTLVRAALTEGADRFSATRARAIGMVAATVEAAENAGLETGGAWTAFDEQYESMRNADTPRDLENAAMAVLKRLAHRTAAQPQPDPSLAALNEMLAPRIHERVLLKDIAAAMGVHPTAITHRLKRKFGMTFTEYVGRLRIDEAKRLLRTTQLTVRQCARRVGINDPANFTRLFRKYENMTPLEYRKKYGNRS